MNENADLVLSHFTLVYCPMHKAWVLPGGGFIELRTQARSAALRLNAIAMGFIPGAPRIFRGSYAR